MSTYFDHLLLLSLLLMMSVELTIRYIVLLDIVILSISVGQTRQLPQLINTNHLYPRSSSSHMSNTAVPRGFCINPAADVRSGMQGSHRALLGRSE